MINVIGAGGTGSWLLQALVKMVPLNKVMVWDGDEFEKKNLDRQLFDEKFIGVNKARAMAEMYGVGAIGEYFSAGRLEGARRSDFIICCADNHPARLECLKMADMYQCHVIVAGNEYHDSEAWYYSELWSGGPADPRVYYPEILESRAGDPRLPGCVEEQEDNKQLVIANMTAASLALWHYEFYSSKNWSEVRGTEAEGSLPVVHKQNIWKVRTLTYDNMVEQYKRKEERERKEEAAA